MLQVGVPGVRGILGDCSARDLGVVLRVLVGLKLPVTSICVALMGSLVLLLRLSKSVVGEAGLGGVV